MKILIVQRKDKFEDKDLNKEVFFDYDELMQNEQEIAPCTPVEASHPMYILCKHFFCIITSRYFWNNRNS